MRELLRLAVCAVGVLASVVAMAAYVPFVLEQRSEWDTSVPYHGWQVTAVDVALAVILLALLVVSARTLVRSYRRLRGRTPHRRLMVLLAILPGLFGGAALMLPADPIASWASNHTAEAAHWRIVARQAAINYRKSPPSFATGHQPAPPAVASHLLSVALLGKGWYAAQTPSPALSPVTSFSPHGAILRARALLTQQHWTGAIWSDDALVSESLVELSTTSEAAADLASWMHPADPCGCTAPCGCGTTTPAPKWSSIEVDGVTVRTGFNARDIAFRIGNDVYTMVIGVHRDTAAAANQFELQLIRDAVRRAVKP